MNLLELLIGASLTSIVITAAGSGLISIINANQKAETESRTRLNITRTLDYISDEIRMANQINKTPTTAQTTAAQAVVAAGLQNVLRPGTFPVLYLEMPAGRCWGLPTTDKVIFFVASAYRTPWLPPAVLYRYGRIPGNDGQVNGCSMPVTRAILDGILDTNVGNLLSCPSPGILSTAFSVGSCVEGGKVNMAIAGKKIPHHLGTTNPDCNAPQPPFCLHTTTTSRVFK